MTSKTLNIKTRLQNLSNTLGEGESDFSYMASKLTTTDGDARLHDVLIQSLDRISKMREQLKHEEDGMRKELNCL